MPRLPLGQLEEALANPPSYRQKMDAAGESSFGETYIGILRHAIFRYHKTHDRADAMAYLQHRFDNSSRLHNVSREFDTIGQLDWYMDEYERGGGPTVQTGLRLVVPVAGARGDLKCSGEVTRVDLIPSGGFAGLILANEIEAGWTRQLRFPLIQITLAEETLGIAASQVRVGIIDPSNRRLEMHSYRSRELTDARRRLGELTTALGF